MNAMQNFVVNRLRKLKADCEIAGATKHGPSTGSIRETCVKRFLSEITPQGVELVSGVLVDPLGKVSPQFDLIAVLPEVLPSAMLTDDLALVPVETAILCIEVKSRLDSTSLNQLEKQNSWISKVGSCISGTEAEPTILPTFFLALDSALKQAKLEEWMKANGNTSMGAVIDKLHLIKQYPEYRLVQADSNHQEMLHFCADYFCGLQHLKERRRKAFYRCSPPPFEVYLKGMARAKGQKDS